MGLEGLKAVIAKYEADPEKAAGFSSGGYAIDYDKVWRGNDVIGYVNDQKKDMTNPDIPTFLPTSKTTPEEGSCFVAAQAAAPPEAASAPMTITSPEGAESEEKAAPGPGKETPAAAAPPEGGEAKDLGELGANLGAEAPAKETNPEDFTNRKKEPESDPLGLAGEARPARENLEVLAHSRLEETRRKYFNATASLHFDVEAKSYPGGERICLYLLPVTRSEGKYEVYDHLVTKNTSLPSPYAVQQAIFAATAEAIPHVTVSRNQLAHIARRVYSAMRGAKDLAGGKEIEESIEEEIAKFLEEDGRKTALASKMPTLSRVNLNEDESVETEIEHFLAEAEES